MTLALDLSALESAQPLDAAPDQGSLDAALAAAIAEACQRIAPVWPLASFVAVNPFLGFADTPFDEAARTLARQTGARMLMPRSFYRDAVQSGRISLQDLAAATQPHAARGLTPDVILAALDQPPRAPISPTRIATVAEVLDTLSAGDRQVSRTAFMVDEISKWCAAYFDEGQAVWSAPWRGKPLLAAWRIYVRHDANARAMGVRNLSRIVAELPEPPLEAIRQVLEALHIPPSAWGEYLYRALFDIRGWAAYVRRLDWEAEQAGADGHALADLLAIRVIWGYALFRQRDDEAFRTAWRQALAASTAAAPARGEDDLAIDLILHVAYERGYQARLVSDLAAGPQTTRPLRPQVQAVFCIDVRSELYRRALEEAWPQAETLGFAGFFGMPLAYGDAEGHVHAQCPVLLQPSVCVEAHAPAGAASRRAGQAFWSRFKDSAVACFGFVEAFGLAYGAKLLKAARPTAGHDVPPPEPHLHLDHVPLASRIDMAHGALKGMSLTRDFARLVLLVGHGSSTVNNPHAAGLDCGACGGHSGAPNARFAAALLNDPQVREGLAVRGVAIPADTWFLAALHDTTTDDLWLLDLAKVPASHAADIVVAKARLARASAQVRAERAPLLGLTPSAPEALVARSRDWSQVRPEWGLARAGAFIAAPRRLTAGRNLEGRAFLHSYDRHADADLSVLELILTAPMVVASWISLQYYGSTVDNRAFGAGDKTLHNVCGRIGVLEGNAGDLRTGLPMQSIHDGTRFVHEPVRLNVFVATTPQAMSQVIARQPGVRTLVDNQWIHLFALDDAGRTTHRYAGDLAWEALS